MAQLASSSGSINQAYPNLLNAAAAYSSMAPNPAFYGNFLQHNPIVHPPQLPPLSSLDFPWPPYGTHIQQQPHQTQAGPSHYDPNTLTGMQHTIAATGAQPPASYWEQQFPVTPASVASPPIPSTSTAEASTTARATMRGQSTSSGPHSASSPEVEMTEAERHAISDEKRRRNTAASGVSCLYRPNNATTILIASEQHDSESRRNTGR